MADVIGVDLEKMGKDIQTLTDNIKTIREDINQLFCIVEELDSMWDGQANEAFMNQFNQDNENFKIVCDNVEGMIKEMNEARNEYIKCEEYVGSEIDTLKF